MARLHFSGCESDAFTIDDWGTLVRSDLPVIGRAPRERRKWLRKRRRQQRDWQAFLRAFRAPDVHR